MYAPSDSPFQTMWNFPSLLDLPMNTGPKRVGCPRSKVIFMGALLGLVGVRATSVTADVAPAPTREQLAELLSYDDETGVFTWRRHGVNALRAGAVAGRVNRQGYVVIKVSQRQYRAHRLAWFMVYGTWPAGQIDHINGQRADNRIANLRDVSRSVNCQNQRKAMSSNTTGLLGVRRFPRNKTNPFAAAITVAGKSLHLGYHPTAEEAHAAYVLAKKRLHEGCTL